MSRGDRIAQAARGVVSHILTVIAAASRARRNAVIRIQLDIRRQIRWKTDAVTRLLVRFQREFLRRCVNLPQVIDAGIGLGGRSGFDEIGDGDRRQKANNGYHNHDFHEREAGPIGIEFSLHLFGGLHLAPAPIYEYNYENTFSCPDQD